MVPVPTKSEFEVCSKNEVSGSLTLVIKRKHHFDDSQNNSFEECGFSEKMKNDFLQRLKEEEMRFQRSSIASFYDRPSVSYKTLILMAFAELGGKEQDGLQTHEIAQWMCRK